MLLRTFIFSRSALFAASAFLLLACGPSPSLMANDGLFDNEVAIDLENGQPTPSDKTQSKTEYKARATGYYPSNEGVEGGYKDRKGNKLFPLQTFLKGNAPYVSVAMDAHAFPYGTKLKIPEFEQHYGKEIEFRVVDTGSAFKGKGTSRIDVCVETKKDVYHPLVNGVLTLIPIR